MASVSFSPDLDWTDGPATPFCTTYLSFLPPPFFRFLNGFLCFSAS